jgi:hypothetical protein
MSSGYVIAEGAFLGEFTKRDSAGASSDWSSQAYFCPDCGEIWARRVNTEADGTPRPFRVLYATCRQHQDCWTIPGALTTHDFTPGRYNLSPELLKREFEILLNYFEGIL